MASDSSKRPTGAVLPGRFVVTGHRGKYVGPTDAAHAHEVDGEPTIELVQENGVIHAINITCACGEKIRVSCVYDS